MLFEPPRRFCIQFAVVAAAILIGCDATAITTQIDGAPVHHYALPNGLHVWHVERRDSTSVAMVLEIQAGSRHETEANNGIAHFVEHYVHGGTRRWDAAEMDRLGDSLGGAANAATTLEHTRYFRETAPAQLDASMELLAELAMHPVFPPDRLQRELDVVMRENAGPDEPLQSLWDRFGVGDISERQLYEQLFPGSTMKLRPIGTSEALSTVDIVQLREFYQMHYLPNNATLIVSGGIGPDAVKDAVERYFGVWLSRPLPERPSAPSPRQSDPIRIVQRGFTLKPQGNIWMGARTAPAEHGDQIGMEVLAQLLQRRLFDRLRTQDGLVYGVFAQSRAWSDAGEFRIAATAAPEHLARVESAVDEELTAISSQAVSTEELALAKRVILTRRALAIDRNLTRSFELLDRIRASGEGGPRDHGEQIEAITPDEIQRLASEYLGTSSRYVVMHKPWMTGRGLRLAIGLAATIVVFVLAPRWFTRRRARSTT